MKKMKVSPEQFERALSLCELRATSPLDDSINALLGQETRSLGKINMETGELELNEETLDTKKIQCLIRTLESVEEICPHCAEPSGSDEPFDLCSSCQADEADHLADRAQDLLILSEYGDI